MPRPKRTSTKRYKAEEVSEDSSAGSGSDFDDDEDPDKIEVPGGGKDLATAAGIGGVKEEKPSIPAPLIKGQGGVSILNQKFSNKIPGGLVTKSNAAPGYEMVRVGGSQGTPGFMGAGGMGPVGQMPASNPYGFPPSLASLAGFNPAAFFQQSKSTSAMEMSNMMGMGSLMSLGSMTGLSPFMLQQFLNQNGMHQNWSGGLSGITSIALTTDGWTSIAVESYVSLTLNYITKNFEARHFMLEIKPFGESHTSQHLFEFAAQAIEEWGLQRDATTTIYFVTDNAPNIVRALSMNEDWIRIPCFAHTLQLCVKDAIEACKGFVELCRKCRGIVGFFGRSSTARQSLLMMQKVSDPNSIPLDLIQDVDTRWNFQYDMLERFVHLRRALGAVLSEPKMPDNLTGTEWNMIATYVRLLAPLKDATILMSGEDYPTLSTYIPITDGLIKATQTFINSGSEGNLLGRNLLTSLNARFDGRYDNVTLLMAMLTDPRYKNRLLPDEKKPAAIEILRQQILSLKNRMKAPDRPLQRGEPLQPVISKTAGKAVSQLWMNSGDPGKMSMQPTLPEEEEVDDEDMGVAETYADYMPTKLKLGRKHPDPVVETASLSSVEPTDVWYKVVIPEEIIRSGALSALQLESITYASQQHEHLLPDGTRAGFLVGDGAGVGKGRTIAGIIFENYLRGRKRAIWVSVSNDLKYDAERDLKDIGAGKIEVHPLNKFKYAKISSAVNGNVKKGVIFSTYSALIGESSQSGGKYKSRLKQLLQWCGEDFDGLIVFDECHRAKNLCPTGSSKPTKTGLTVLELQNKLPKARVVYASATGASEPRNMAYMVRCGMWGEGTPFPEFTDFIAAVEKRGVGAMEIVAMDMKLRGMYIARQLSFHGVAFKIEEVPLSKEFTKVYDTSVRLWVEAMQKFQEAAELIDAENRMKKTMWGQFWSSHQRFFKYLCIAAKVKHAVAVAREAVKCGKCVVIGLQSTGEARTLEQLERDDGELSDFVSTAKGVLQTLVEKHFPAPDRNRIHRLLGLEPPKTGKSHNGDLEEAGGSAGKRKPVRQAAQRASKKVKTWSTDDDVSEDDRNGGGRSSGSEFKLSGTESEEENRSDDESNASSDFNPFYSDSDSDADPWDRRKKKGKKHKKSPKKRLSTQDKIQSMLASKTSHNKSKRNGDSSMGMPGMGSTLSQAPPRDAIERACSIKEELLAQIESLGEKLPPNTLDQLIDELGGPENVAEMTGRKGRVVQTEDGAIQYESRSEVDVPLETLNLTEKQRFMDGEKTVAIISEAASSGISLQSDRRARNQMRRVHITLELPWSADRAIQQFGRTHRSNQVNAPEYIFLISDLAGERRFASIVAKRLESLGALTHGDRRATETRDLSQFNIDNKYGRAALEATMKTIMGYDSPLVPPPQDYKGDFFKDVADALVGVGLICNSENMPGVLTLDKDYNNMSKFLNRILGMPVDLQNRLFKYFTDTLNAIVTQAKKTGRFDMGILDLGTSGENVKRVKLYRFLRKHATGIAPTELHIVHVERGMSWSEAMDRWASLTGSKEGFYLSHQVRNGKQTAILAIAVEGGKKKVENKKDQLYTVYRPNTGLQLRQESLGELEKKYKKVPTEEAEPHWIQQYDSSVDTCSHAYWRGNCKNTTLGLDCEVGLRRRSYNVLAGSVLSVWSRVENVLAARSGHNSKMQVVRLRTDESLKIVGTLIPKTCMESLREALSSDAEKTEEQTF